MFWFFFFFLDAIVERILEAGFFIADIKEATITSDIAEALYEDMKDKDFYKELINFMTRYLLGSCGIIHTQQIVFQNMHTT